MDATQVITTIASNFPDLHVFLLTSAKLLGFIIGAIGIWELSRYSKLRQEGMSPMSGIYKAMGGSVLMTLPLLMGIGSSTIFGSSDSLRTAVSYTDTGGDQAKAMLTLLFGFITLYGWYGGLRGMYILTQLGSNSRDHDASDALVRIAFGAVCANALYATDVIAATLGVENFIRDYLS